MFSIQASLPLIVFSAALLCCLVFSIIRRKALSARLEKKLSHAKPIAAALCIPAGFLLMEIPYNPSLGSMGAKFVLLGLCVTGALFAIVYFLGQRSKTAMIAFLLACFASGVANYFVSSFKGQPVLPSDIMALKTAAAVSGGYIYAIGNSVLAAFCLLVAMIAFIVILPKSKRTPRTVAAHAALGLAALAAFCVWFNAADIEKDYGCTVDVWSSLDSYQQHGSLLCFLERSQLLTPHAPEGYTLEEAARIRSEKAAAALATETIDEGQATAPDIKPAIVVIMNETFSDLSRYPGLAGTDARPAHYYDIAAEALEAGDAYASALGGGTCNSEFEFLTGSSMGHLGGGVYPYVLYDLDGTESLVSYFSSLGYATHAVHPAESTNWRRDRVYEQLGFDEFADQRAFANADTLRGLTTDRATYDYVLDLLEADEGPQFVFDVTLQNHGGYDVGGLSDELAVSVPLGDGSRSSELDEYASVIRQADRDLAYLVDRLNALDRPVVLCFFGDHQPGFSDWLFEATHDGAAADDLGLEAVQERYTVPYLIWANDAARAQGAHEPQGVAHERTSLNYLGSRLVEAAGLPTTSYQRFLLAMREAVPAINLNGFLTADGIWHGFGNEEAAGVLDALQAYATVQYDNLFNKDSAWAVK